jgi:glutamate formiminotransferase
MGGSAWLDLRAALHARLSGDVTLASIVGTRVFNGDPAKAPAVPYVVIGEAEEDPNNRMGGRVGREVMVPIHMWSKTTTDAQRDSLADRVDELLDNQASALTVTGWDVESLDMESMQYLIDSPVGGQWTPTRHTIARYRVNLRSTT